MLDPSFEVAKELKDRAQKENTQLRLEVDMHLAQIALLETQLDHEQARHREAAAQLELTKADRTYWQGQYDQLAKEMHFIYSMLGEIRAFSQPR